MERNVRDSNRCGTKSVEFQKLQNKVCGIPKAAGQSVWNARRYGTKYAEVQNVVEFIIFLRFCPGSPDRNSNKESSFVSCPKPVVFLIEVLFNI